MNADLNCADDRAYCDSHHEGLCMLNLPGFPKKISRLHKCPLGELKDVIQVKDLPKDRQKYFANREVN